MFAVDKKKESAQTGGKLIFASRNFVAALVRFIEN
jgi:hypothetical protein